MWWPGEQERLELFYLQRAQRFAHRAMLLQALSGDPDAYLDNLSKYAALLRQNIVEEEFEETCPPTNQNVW